MGLLTRSSAAFVAILCAALAAAAGGCAGEVSPEALQLLQHGEGAFQADDQETALRDLDLFLKDNSSSRLAGEAYYYRGRTHLAMNNRAGAKADLTQAAGLLSDQQQAADAMLTLGKLAEEAGDPPAAERLYRQSIDKLDLGQKPADEALFRLGCALQKEGRWADADGPLDRLIFLFPDEPLARQARQKVRCTAWTIRVAVAPARPPAAAEAAALTGAGLPASVREIVIDEPLRESGPGGRLAFSVEVGRYAAYAQAAAELPEVRAKAPRAVIVETR